MFMSKILFSYEDLKSINEIFYFPFFYEIFKIWCVFYTYWASHISSAQQAHAAGGSVPDLPGRDLIQLRADVFGRSIYGVTACV